VNATALLLILNLLFVGALPRIFFRSGTLGLSWWLTALPFVACTILVFLHARGILAAQPGILRAAYPPLALAAVPLSAASIALIAYTLGTHRIPISLWHQGDDAPRHIVTWGAYARIRHPFYAAFLLALLAAFLYFPHLGTVATLLYGFAVLTWTARREERRLRASEFGAEYADYQARTGRFWPRFGARR
jgi:protein-S-isoprenylcysteine O-methyltransferase Ste14